MTSALAFTEAATLVTPPIEGGLPEGLLLHLWVRRTGEGELRPIVELAGAGSRIVVGSGRRADILRLAVITGDKTKALLIPGGLPIDRWVQVRAGIGADGKAWLTVHGMAYAEGKLPAPGAEVRTVKLGGFDGELAQVQVWRHPAPTVLSWDPPVLDAPRLWAYYPLDRTTHDAANKRHVAEDSGPNRRHATGPAAPSTVSHAAPLADGPATYMAFTKDTAATNLSPLPGLSGQVAMEAWVRVDSEAAQPGAVVTLQGGQPRVALVAGGEGGEVALVLVLKDKTVRLCSAKGLITKGKWCHVAATARFLDGSSIEAQVYFQGTSRASEKFEGANVLSPGFLGLATLLRAASVRQCRLGGQVPGLGRLRGGVAEARIWRTAAPQRVEGMWLARARGDEVDLVACYRLDDLKSHSFGDISPRRGLGRAVAGVQPGGTDGPPLAATTGATPFRLAARGKLVREWVPPAKVKPANPNSKINLELSSVSPRIDVNVFDATVEARAHDGTARPGLALEVRVDRALTAILGSADKAKRVAWKADETRVVQMTAEGRARLRFIADDLACPTIRVRVAGAAGGVWTVIRPDVPVQQRLRTMTGSTLANPGGGRKSPLPAGASSEDAEALASAFRQLGTQFVPAPAVQAPVRQAKTLGISKFSWGDIGDAVEDGWEATSDAAEEGWEATSDAAEEGWEATSDAAEEGWEATSDAAQGALDAAAEALDPAQLGNTILDTGSGVIAGATRVTKSAGALLRQTANDVDALKAKAAGTISRTGASAITALVDSADAMAITLTKASSTGLKWVEIVGTTIVDGAEAAWRVIVSGVDEALAAVEALIKRIGAAIEDFIEFLAYLFQWGDFLAASDEVYALLEKTLSQLHAKIPQLGEYKQKLVDSLRTGVEQAIGKRSVGDLFGIDADDARPAIEPLDYVLEKLQEALDSADLVFDLADDMVSGLGAPQQSLLDAANGLADRLPTAQLASVTGLLTTPVSQLLAGNGGLADGSSSLLDALFGNLVESGQAATKFAEKQFKARIKVPWLTEAIEEGILGGRTFSLMRMVALVAAIFGVVTKKSVSKAQSRSAAGSLRTLDGAQQRARTQVDRDTEWALWASMSLGLLNSILLVTKTGLEWAGVTKSSAARKVTAIMGAVGGVCIGLRGVLTFVRLPGLPAGTRPYAGTNAGLEIVAGGWTVLSAYVTFKVDDLWRPFDLVAYGLLGLATTTVSAVALATGNLQGENQIVSFSLRCGSWVGSSLARLSEKYDDKDPSGRLKVVTVGLVVVSSLTDIAEAIYGNVDEVQQQTG